ncbi:MAG: hypothetical protein KAV82_15610, partial [Phycisphaerae bacterium]|nr:hypothetical protein [Phycisphaerae bacterium]
CDIAAGTSADCNTNGIPDECDVVLGHDCCETGHGAGCSDPAIEDCVCQSDRYCCETEWDDTCVDEVTSLGCGTCEPTSEDCQPDGVPDECQLADNDCNSNGTPDDCESDYDGDGVIDDCDDDIDNDGVLNGDDVCDYTPPGAAVDSEGRPLGDIDQDCDTDLADYALFQQGFTGPL